MKLFPALSLAVVLASSACVVRASPVMYEQEYADEAPPTPQVEVVGVAPSPNHLWVGGHWAWRGRRWVWAPGTWVVTRENHAWVPGYWQRRGRHHVWVEGAWRRL